MRTKTFYIFIILFLSIMTQTISAQDWANLNRYKIENAALTTPSENENRVVFMGNSITEAWSTFDPNFFRDHHYINRGISGQTTPQMLLRFRADVINLKPDVVVILAGTNDLAENTGPIDDESIMNNIISMVQLAKVNDIKVVLCSVLPAYDFPWKPGLHPDKKIPILNDLIKKYADENAIEYSDYFSAMVGDKNNLNGDYTHDGVHPNAKGYQIMAPIAQEALVKTLKKQ